MSALAISKGTTLQKNSLSQLADVVNANSPGNKAQLLLHLVQRGGSGT